MATSAYEELRRKNLEDNKRILAELGLSNPFKSLPRVITKGTKRQADKTYEPQRKKAKRISAAVDVDNCGSLTSGTRRLSARLRGQEPGTECVAEDDKLEGEHEKSRVKYQYVMPDRPNWYGSVPGVDVGTIWMMRVDCCRDGIHRPTVAGIHGGPEGAYSLALSGGYEDDIDLGDCFTYTGEGGRDLKGTRNNPKNLRTAPQSKDQDLTRGNLALSRSVESGNPVRVIRGYKLRSPFAPEEGYRYDGLYTVEKFWFTKGMSGFGVYKFALRRCNDQAPPPWVLASEANSPSKSSDSGFSDYTNAESESAGSKKGDAYDSDLDSASTDDRQKMDLQDSEEGCSTDGGQKTDLQDSEEGCSADGGQKTDLQDSEEGCSADDRQKTDLQDLEEGCSADDRQKTDLQDSEEGCSTDDRQKTDLQDSEEGCSTDDRQKTDLQDSEEGCSTDDRQKTDLQDSEEGCSTDDRQKTDLQDSEEGCSTDDRQKTDLQDSEEGCSTDDRQKTDLQDSEEDCKDMDAPDSAKSESDQGST